MTQLVIKQGTKVYTIRDHVEKSTNNCNDHNALYDLSKVGVIWDKKELKLRQSSSTF